MVFLKKFFNQFCPGTSRDREFCPGTFAPALVPGQRDTGTGKFFFVPGQRDNRTGKLFCPGTKGQQNVPSRFVPLCPRTSCGTSRPLETLDETHPSLSQFSLVTGIFCGKEGKNILYIFRALEFVNGSPDCHTNCPS